MLVNVKQIRPSPEAHQWLSTLLVDVSDGIAFVAADGTIRFASPAVEKLLGSTAERLRGTEFRDHVYEVDRSSLDTAIARCLSTPHSREEANVRIVHASGSLRPVLVRCTNRQSDPQTGALVLLLQDVSERERDREALKRSEQRYGRLFQTAPVGMYQSAADGTILVANPALAAILGYESPEELLQRNLSRDVYLTTEARDRLIEEWEPSGGVADLEIQWKRKDGTPIWVVLTAHAVKDEAGETLYFEGLVRDVTDRHLAADRLAASERRFRRLVESGWDVIVLAGADGVIDYVSPSIEGVMGYTVAEYQGSRVFDRTHPDDRPRALDRFAEILARPGLQLAAEIRAQHRNGSWRWLEVRGVNLLDDPDVGALVGTFRDVTEQRLAEEALRKSESDYRLLMEQAADAIFLMDRTGRYLDVNSRACELTGYSREELLGMDIVNLAPPDEREAAAERGAEARAHGQRLVERRVLKKDGSIILVEANIKALPDGRIQSIARDITARKDQEERLRILAAATNDAVWDWNVVSDEIWWGEGLRTLFGYDPEGFNFPLWVESLHADDRDRVVQGLMDVVDTRRRHWEAEYRFRKADGEYADVRDRGELLLDAGGRPLRMVGAVQDMTDRKRAEDALRQAQKMDAIGRLTGGIAHDFNNLLTVVLANAELLADPGVGDVPAEVRDIQAAARRGQAMVRKLLGFARRTTLDLAEVDVTQLVNDVCAMLQRVLPESISLNWFTDDQLPRLTADAGAIEQVLFNLATNARDAMPEGGSLGIEAHLVEVGSPPGGEDVAHGGAYVRLRVRDSGIGMSEETRRRVFEPFFTTKPAGHGTGLGMAMVYGLVQQHRGFMDVRSRLGAGTTIDVYLPLARSHRSSGTSRVAPDLSPALERGTGTILLAEDEPEVRRAAMRVLERSGYRVIAAPDGEDALRLFRAHREEIDLVLSDLVMPKMGGKALYDAIRNEGGTMPFLFASGYAERDAAPAKGLDAQLIGKPWTVHELIEHVRRALKPPGVTG